MPASQTKRFEGITQQQLQCYIRFCKQHPEIRRGKTESCDISATPKLCELWTQLVNRLNALRGPTLTMKRWKETLLHWKTQVRSRLCRYKKQIERNRITSVYCDNSYAREEPLVLESTDISEVQTTRQMSTTFSHQISEVGAEQNDDDDYSADNHCSPSIPSYISHIKQSQRKNMNAKVSKVNYAGIFSTIIKTLEARRER